MEDRARLGGYFLRRKCGQERNSGLGEGHWTFPSRRKSQFQEVKDSASLQAISLGSSHGPSSRLSGRVREVKSGPRRQEAKSDPGD